MIDHFCLLCKGTGSAGLVASTLMRAAALSCYGIGECAYDRKRLAAIRHCNCPCTEQNGLSWGLIIRLNAVASCGDRLDSVVDPFSPPYRQIAPAR